MIKLPHHLIHLSKHISLYCLNTCKYIQVAHQTSTGPVVTTPKCSSSCYLHRESTLSYLNFQERGFFVNTSAPWKVPVTQQCRTLGAFPSGCWPCWSSFSLLVCEHFNEIDVWKKRELPQIMCEPLEFFGHVFSCQICVVLSQGEVEN